MSATSSKDKEADKVASEEKRAVGTFMSPRLPKSEDFTEEAPRRRNAKSKKRRVFILIAKRSQQRATCRKPASSWFSAKLG
jgi:hypothetical protein